MLPPKKAASIYKQRHIEGLPPIERILIVYTAAIDATQKRNLEKLEKALIALEGALDFTYGVSLCRGLSRLYRYCRTAAKKGDFDEAWRILAGLRNFWILAGQKEAEAARKASKENPNPTNNEPKINNPS